MLKSKIVATGAKWLLKAKGFAILHAPAALVAIGAGLVVWAIVETAKAASQPNDELEQAVGDLEEANENLKKEELTVDEVKAFRKDKRVALKTIIKEFIRQFKKPVMLATLGLSAMVGGYLWVAKRFAAAAAEAASTAATLGVLDRNMRRTFGDGLTNAMYSEDFNPDDFDKQIADSRVDPLKDKDGGAVGSLNAEGNQYASKVIGSEDSPDLNLYHWNKHTVEAEHWYENFGSRIAHLKWLVADLQNSLDNKPEVTLLTREQLLKGIGLLGATWHNSDTVGEKHARDDGLRAVCKGDKIDFGLDEMFKEYTSHLDDPNWLKYMEEKYDDIVIRINCNYDAYKRAKLADDPIIMNRKKKTKEVTA